MCFESLVVINIHIRSQFSKESKATWESECYCTDKRLEIEVR